MSTWHIDGAHSEIGFKVKHLMVSNVKGSFKTFSGTLTADDDNLTNAQVSFEADAASVTTNNDMRDGHIMSPEFFDVAQFPKVTFVSKSFTKKEGNEYAVTGDFTMKGVTKEITLEATFGGLAKGMDGKRVAAFEITGMINRMDYGVSWNSPIETGGVVVSPEVWLTLSVELKEE